MSGDNDLDIDWDHIQEILKESYIYGDNDQDIVDLCEELENQFYEEDGNQETLRNDLIEAVTTKNDVDFFFFTLLKATFKFSLQERLNLYEILLYQYIKLQELNKSNIINLLKSTIKSLNYEKIIDLKQFENIARHRKPDFNGNAFYKMDYIQFANIFNKMNISQTIWQHIFDTEMAKWANQNHTKNNNNKQRQKQNLTKKHVHFAPIPANDNDNDDDYKEEEEEIHQQYHQHHNHDYDFEEQEEEYNGMTPYNNDINDNVECNDETSSESDEKAETSGTPILSSRDLMHKLIQDEVDTKTDILADGTENDSSLASSQSSYSNSDSDDSKESKKSELSKFGGKIKRPKLKRHKLHKHNKHQHYYPLFINKCVKFVFVFI